MVSNKKDTSIDQVIEISNTGEYTVIHHPESVVRSSDYSIKINKINMREVFMDMLKPDSVEVGLLMLALLINLVLVTPSTKLYLFDPYMLIFWGMISMFLYTIRWSYIGADRSFNIWSLVSPKKTNNHELMTGIIIELKLIGIICSSLLMTIGFAI